MLQMLYSASGAARSALQIGEAMVGAMNQFVTENPTRFAGTLEQDFRLSELPDFVRALNTYLDNHDFNHVDLRTIRTLTRDLRTAKEPRAA